MSTQLSQRITQCRICAGTAIEPVLDLGIQPPANSLRKNLNDPLPRIPLVVCRCGACGTVQLTETVDPAYLFQRYVWVTGTSRTATEYSRFFCDNIRAHVPASGALRVVEVASNDGTFLRRFQEAGDEVLGIDPAKNIAAAANAAGITTWPEFFGPETGRRISRELGGADVAFARNVLPHVPDPVGILRGMADCLKDNGLVVVEFHNADAILNELHYDSIYHEHLFYHSLGTMERQLAAAGLHAFDLMTSPISGGSLVLFCSRELRQPSESLCARRELETLGKTNTLDRWQDFARRSRAHRDQLCQIVEEGARRHPRMIGYGASARSSTLLNFCRIDRRHLQAIADRSPYKHNYWTPGTDIQILSPSQALALRPQCVLLLAWNFRDEILEELKSGGYSGEVIIPLPGDPTAITL